MAQRESPSKAMLHRPPVPSSYSPPRWTTLWFALSTLIVYWDAGYCLLRPRSMAGGDLSALWNPYQLYATIDLVYGPAMLLAKDGFTAAQALLNLVENALNITYLLKLRRGEPHAILIGFTAVLLTFWKTTLYILMDYMCGQDGWCQTGHNDRRTWYSLYVLPNGCWIVVPFLIACILGRQIAHRLSTSDAAAAVPLKSGKAL